jgi:hypothetical protein
MEGNRKEGKEERKKKIGGRGGKEKWIPYGLLCCCDKTPWVRKLITESVYLVFTAPQGTWQQAGSNGAAKHSQLIHKQEGKTTPSNTSQIVPPTGGGGVETKYSNI